MHPVYPNIDKRMALEIKKLRSHYNRELTADEISNVNKEINQVIENEKKDILLIRKIYQDSSKAIFNYINTNIEKILIWLCEIKKYDTLKFFKNQILGKGYINISHNDFMKIIAENGAPISLLKDLGMTKYDYNNAITKNYVGALDELKTYISKIKKIIAYYKENKIIKKQDSNYVNSSDESGLFIDLAIKIKNDDYVCQLIDLDIEWYNIIKNVEVGKNGIERKIIRYDDGIFFASQLKPNSINRKLIDYLLTNNKKELLDKYMDLEPFKYSAYIIAINTFSNIETLSTKKDEQNKNIELYRNILIKSSEEIDFNINKIASDKNAYDHMSSPFIENVIKRNDEELFDKLIEQYCRINCINLDDLYNKNNMINKKIDLLYGLNIETIINVKCYSLFVKILSLTMVKDFSKVVIADIKRIKWVIGNITKNISTEDLVTLQIEG